MKRILICPHTLDYGGSQLSVHHWAKYLNNDQFDIHILAMKRGGLSNKIEEHYTVHYDDYEYPNIAKYIDKIAPNLVHACPAGGQNHGYIQIASQNTITTQTLMCPRDAGNIDDVDFTVVPSEYSYSLQTSTKNVAHIDHPFDLDDYAVIYDKDHFNIPKDKRIILSFGNPRKENSHFHKIAKLHKNNNNLHFVFKGSPPPGLRKKQKNITIINKYISEDEKISLFRLADIFLYPTSNEAYGIVFLEAMMHRTPIISYCDSANPEVIRNGGVLAPLNDIKTMNKLLVNLINRPNQADRLGSNGYNLVTSRNNPITISRKYEKLFNELIFK